MAKRSDGINGPEASLRRTVVWGFTGVAMVLPVLLLNATSSGPWDPGDLMFLIMLWSGVVAAFEVAARAKVKAYRLAVGIAAAASLLQIWINLAVGIVGSENNPANWIYAGVIAVAACGTVAARFDASGMARAMMATAVAQAAAFVAALVGGLGFTGPITVFFCALWLISAWLFRRAAANEPLDEVCGGII